MKMGKSYVGSSGDPQQVAICLAELYSAAWLWLKSKCRSICCVHLCKILNQLCVYLIKSPVKDPKQSGSPEAATISQEMNGTISQI